MPKAVYRSGCSDQHNRPRCDPNLGPLTPQSDALTTRPLRPAADHAADAVLGQNIWGPWPLSFPYPPLLIPFFLLEVGPLNAARGSGGAL